ncbi:CoA-binding protein [Cupriavidus gilardii]|uniref:acetate--CoA ligase family protein n=1 Tax=Cupriavidus gilardii TaxID=82541 RepID=UPI001EE53030|nr:acetate--CoA ligase family protein [Cupriavidus gilardii]MCG5258989.1 acetate--CoA ligase family protein [Cupriavidus gilardii]MDF9429151.1 CoA-binding protein [Cupriavidus gilardii]
MAHRLDPLLNPQSIAIVGASDDAGRIGGMPIDLLTRFGYRGKIHPVNPKYETVFGLRCHPSIEALPEDIDLAVLAIGAEQVTPMLKRCHARGIRAAIVYAAGFAEAGESGAALQQEMEDFVRSTGMAVAGPNCMGFANLNTHAYTAFASVFRTAPAQRERGTVSLLTQSGNVCAAVFAIARELRVPFSQFINTGNEACLDFAEYLQFLAQDPDTDVVLGYIEELRDGARFIDAAIACAEADKPVIVYKAGETDKGREAVRSHTSALAGNQQIYRAAFAQLNVIECQDFAQMAHLAELARYRGRSAGRRVAIVSISGAVGAILADKCIGAGLEVPTLPQALQQTLRAGIPDYGMVSNPVDVTGNVVNDPGFVRTALGALATSDAIDAVIVYAPGYLLDRMADDLIETAAAHPRLLLAIDTGRATRRDDLRTHGVPVMTDIGMAMQTLPPLLQWHERRNQRGWRALRNRDMPQQLRSTPATATALATTGSLSRLRERAGERELAAAMPAPPALPCDEHAARRYLAAHGVGDIDGRVVRHADEAAAAAVELGFPVVLKVLSADLPHKTEVGGVRLNLGDADAVRKACAEMLASVRKHAPRARIDGVLVQPMLSGGVELIVGAVRDPVFGPTLTVGLGGVLTELYRDVSHRLLPVDRRTAEQMLRELRAFPLLDGFRGRPLCDVPAACAAIAAFSDAVLALGEAADEVEINPLLVRERGQGVAMLDALIVPKRQ